GMKVQLSEPGAIKNAAICSNHYRAAGPGGVRTFRSVVHSIYQRRKLQVKLSAAHRSMILLFIHCLGWSQRHAFPLVSRALPVIRVMRLADVNEKERHPPAITLMQCV